MEELFEKYQQKLQYTSLEIVRSIMQDIDWNSRLIGIKGARGIGKTTLLLQYIKLNLQDEQDNVLYASLDNIWFSNHTLKELVDYFIKRGGKYLFLDEVHKYPNWAQELKNIYDEYLDLKVVFTGSSLLEIPNPNTDLSRNAIIYKMQGLSFREFIAFETGLQLDSYSLEEIVANHIEISHNVLSKIKPLPLFEMYLKKGYYPFYKENPEMYSTILLEIINMSLEIELPLLRKVELSYVFKIKQLLLIVSESVPFVPNTSKLSAKMGIVRGTLLLYLYYLSEIGITHNLYKECQGISKLQKPNKIYLENSNLMFALAPKTVNIGNLRETFFANQLSYKHELHHIDETDFFVSKKYSFEIGGKSKTTKQIFELENAYIAADNVEFGYKNTIPLWLFGFLY